MTGEFRMYLIDTARLQRRESAADIIRIHLHRRVFRARTSSEGSFKPAIPTRHAPPRPFNCGEPVGGSTQLGRVGKLDCADAPTGEVIDQTFEQDLPPRHRYVLKHNVRMDKIIASIHAGQPIVRLQ